MLTYSFFPCYCTSTEGTNHHQFGKMCPILDVPLMGEHIIIFVKLHVSRANIRKYTYYLILYNQVFGKYLEPWKELKRFE